MKKYYYSIDGGATWEGPFSSTELDNFRGLGMIDEHTMLKEEGAAPAPAAAMPPFPQPAAGVGQTSPSPEPGYLLTVNGNTSGPFSLVTLRSRLDNGELQGHEMVWMEGMPAWVRLDSLLPPDATQVKLPKLKNFSMGSFFSAVFRHHTEDEMMECFIAGTSKGTPPLSEVSTRFPTPWVFARMILFCVILYIGFSYAYTRLGHPCLLPAMMVVGNFGIPFSIFVLFYELNVRRDVTFYAGIKALLCGAFASMIVSLLLFVSFDPEASFWAGAIEEPAKLLTAVFLAGKLRNGRILNGLLIGAAVGAGFSAFESLAYAFVVCFANNATIGDLNNITEMRALLSPFAHVVWTAITAGAYWMVMDNKITNHLREKTDTSLDFSILIDRRFLMIAAIPIALHMCWNYPIFNDFAFLKCIALGVAAWIVALRLVVAGLNQIEREKQENK